jgi:hypothetical protein
MRLAIDERVDLSNTLKDSIIQLRKEVPQELVVSMFQKLVRNFFLLFFFFQKLIHFMRIQEFTSNIVHPCWQANRLGDKKGCGGFVDKSFTSCRCVI